MIEPHASFFLRCTTPQSRRVEITASVTALVERDRGPSNRGTIKPSCATELRKLQPSWRPVVYAEPSWRKVSSTERTTPPRVACKSCSENALLVMVIEPVRPKTAKKPRSRCPPRACKCPGPPSVNPGLRYGTVAVGVEGIRRKIRRLGIKPAFLRRPGLKTFLRELRFTKKLEFASAPPGDRAASPVLSWSDRALR